MKFSENQQVIINPNSKHRYQGMKNDRFMVGVIFEVRNNTSSDYKYIVRWENEDKNGYRNRDLLPYNTEPNYEIY